MRISFSFPFTILVLLLCFPLTNWAEKDKKAAASAPAIDTSKAISALLQDARKYHVAGQNEQAAALLERALRIEPRNPILWHNLAGVRLLQEDWVRAANLANKSNSLAAKDKWLRVRNWVLIRLACEGMSDHACAQEAAKRARALADTTEGN